MTKFVAVPHDWSSKQAEDFQRLHEADGLIKGLPLHLASSELELPLVWGEGEEE